MADIRFRQTAPSRLPRLSLVISPLAIALIVTYFAFNPLVRRGASGGIVRGVTVLTIAAWLMVAMAGRWIGFS